MCAGEHTCVCTQRPEVNIECLSQQLFTLTFRYNSSADPGARHSTRLAWEQVETSPVSATSLISGLRFQIHATMLNFSQKYWESRLTSRLPIKYFISCAISPVPWFFLFVFFSQSYSFVVQTRLKRTLNSLIFLPLFPKVLAWWVCVTMQCWKCKSVPCAC